MKNQLKKRHIQMIALGGAIGTGLFFGSAKSIQMTGPSIVLSYIFGGIVLYIIMRALGEMTVHNPNTGAYTEYAHSYIGPYAGFISGWNAWFEYTVVCMVELTAITFFLDLWVTSIPHWLICLVVLVIFAAINLMSVRLFGEFEFWFAGIKIFAIIAMLAFTAYLVIFKHGINPDFGTYFSEKILFSHGMEGFAFSLVIVMFSFGGTEFVSIAAGNAENPDKTIPGAINGVVIRILLFYVLTMLAIMLLYPYEQLSGKISPFVDVFLKVGLSSAAMVMNFVAITAALSSFNSSLFSASRLLCNLAENGNAPKRFAKISKNGIPKRSVILTSFCVMIAVLVNFIFPQKAIMYLLTVATCAILVTWFIILITQMYFRKKQIKENFRIKFKLYLFPYSNIFACLVLFIVLGIMTQMDDMKLSVYITPLWILVLSFCYILKKANIINIGEDKK